MADRNYELRYSATPCKWSLNPSEPSPHSKSQVRPCPKICHSILEAVGNTPIVRINNITKQENVQCEVLVKCEFMNPCGSVKDRVGVRLIEDLERSGVLRSGMKIIEPTSGNTGIGLAMAAAVKGYEMFVTMPDRMSQEKFDLLQGMGVKTIKAPSDPDFLAPNGYLKLAEALERDNKDMIMPGQYHNASNPLAHYDNTAEEILDQCDGKLDYIVIGSGSGGQITGLSRKLKEKIPGITVVAVDPKGSVIHNPECAQVGPYKVEGIGKSLVPRCCYTDLVDQWIVTEDQQTFDYARKLIKHESLLVGGSSGAIFYAALQVAKTLPADKRVLAVLPDGVRNYMSGFLNDRWMIQNGFMHEIETPAVAGKTVKDLNLTHSITISPEICVRLVIQMMKEHKVTEIPVLRGRNIVGVASCGVINKMLVSGACDVNDLVEKVMIKKFKVMNLDTSLAFIAAWIEDWKWAVVQDGDFVGMVSQVDFSCGLISI